MKVVTSVDRISVGWGMVGQRMETVHSKLVPSSSSGFFHSRSCLSFAFLSPSSGWAEDVLLVSILQRTLLISIIKGLGSVWFPWWSDPIPILFAEMADLDIPKDPYFGPVVYLVYLVYKF